MNKTLELIKGVEASYATVTIDLGEYDATYAGATFDVWVTPTRGHLDAYQAYFDKWVRPITETGEMPDEDAESEAERNAELDAWLAETWRNHPLEDVTAIRAHLEKSNPRVWRWLYNRTLEVAAEYRETLIKN
jgi:hypothetical protein